MLRLRSVVIIGSLISFSVFANSAVSLSGSVIDEEDAKVVGAIVHLASDATMIDTTTSTGEFFINITTAITGRPGGIAIHSINSIGIKGNQLRFSITAPVSNAMVSLFAGNGKKHTEFFLGKLEAGFHCYSLPEIAPGLYLMSILTDGSTSTRKLLFTGTESFLSDDIYGIKNRTPEIYRASGEIVDTLIVKKEGYAVTKKPIGSYKQTGIAIVVQKEAVYDFGATVENRCSDCVVPDLPDASTLTARNSKLPDPFKKISGTRITKKSEWRCRRQEIIKQAEKYIYGEKPLPPEVVTGTVTSTKISVHVEDKGKSIDFTATVKLPTTGKAPYPAIISVGSFGGVLMGESKILAEGVAIINYDFGKIGAEQQPEGNVDRSKDFTGLFYTIYGGKHSAGLLMAWAWGASRIIDVLQKSGGDVIDYRRLGVTGCSRTAKAAFAIGLFDERMALTLPEETSVVGVPAYRIADAKCPENTDNNFRGQLWLSNNFKPFVKNTSLLPIDAHELVAAFAPRALYSMENPAATQMCAIGGNMSIQGGMDVYKALGAEKNLTYRSDTPSGTGHCSYTSNFTDQLIKNITRFLKHETAETGGIVAGSGGTVTRSDWIDWTAPTLEDDTKIYITR